MTSKQPNLKHSTKNKCGIFLLIIGNKFDSIISILRISKMV